MKNILSTFLIFLLIVTSTSCDKEKLTAFSFTHDYTTFIITVDPTTLQGDIELGTYEIETDIQGLVSDNGVGIDNLTSIKVTAIQLEIEDTDSAAYTFDLTTKIKGEISNIAGTSMIEFAAKDPIPSLGSSSINLDVKDVELVNYFKATKLKCKLSGFTSATIDHSFNLKVTLSTTFKGELLK